MNAGATTPWVWAAEQVTSTSWVIRPNNRLGTHGFIDAIGWEARWCSSARAASRVVAALNSAAHATYKLTKAGNK